MFKNLKILYYLFYRPKIFLPKKSYSMFGEDIFIEKYFRNKKKGFYIDVGGYHPLQGNNTQLLYKKGWRGINFDINSYSIELFDFLRKKDLNIHSGISNKKEKLIMYYRKEINMLNTTDKKLAKIHFRNGYKKKIIQVNSLNFFIKKNLEESLSPKPIVFLRSLDFNHYKPQLICIEIHNTKKMYDTNYKYLKFNKVYNYLVNRRYKVVWKNKYSFIFERKEK